MLLHFVRELGINPLVITCDPQNIASVKTIESLGSKLEATKEVETEPGVLRQTRIYQLWFAQLLFRATAANRNACLCSQQTLYNYASWTC